MKIKLDENLSCQLKTILQKQGHEVFTAEEQGLSGKSDQVVAMQATKEREIIFSQDLDFADIRKFPPGTHHGIIIFRAKTKGPKAVNLMVRKFIDQFCSLKMFVGCLVVVDGKKVRIRGIRNN